MVPSHLGDIQKALPISICKTKSTKSLQTVATFFGQRQQKFTLSLSFPSPKLQVFMQIGKTQEAGARNYIRLKETEVL